MSWFLSRSRPRTDDPVMEEAVLLEGTPREEGPPPDPALILLASDAYGPACRRLHCFDNSEAAALFVKFWYPYRSADAVLGYWLLRGEPHPVDVAEWRATILIIVRDARKGIVYSFTRPDMDTARAFLEEEFGYGLDPASVLLLWAVPVAIETDSYGDTVIFPPSLPDGAAAGNPAITALDERTMATPFKLQRGRPAR